MSEFDDIRPYKDDEVEQVVKKLYKEDELIEGMAKFKFPKLFKKTPQIAKGIVRAFVKRKVKPIKTINDIQHIVGEEFKKILTWQIKEIYVHYNPEKGKRGREKFWVEEYESPTDNFLDIDTELDSPEDSLIKVANYTHGY